MTEPLILVADSDPVALAKPADPAFIAWAKALNEEYEAERRRYRADHPNREVADFAPEEDEAPKAPVYTVDPADCHHGRYLFATHGPLCPDCGEGMIEVR